MKVILYSDGSSRGNPGPGGFGTVLHFTDSNGKASYTRTIAGVHLHHQQPHGASGSYHRAGSTQTSLHR